MPSDRTPPQPISESKPQSHAAPDLREHYCQTNVRPEADRPAAARTVTVPKIRGYEMIAEVGRGALGTVFLAKSESTGQQVAVKVVPIRTPATEIVRRRFLAEMDRVAQARHPNIVGLIERGTVGQAFYFVTEYCDGGNVAQWMESNGGKLKLRRCSARHAAVPRRPEARAFASPGPWQYYSAEHLVREYGRPPVAKISDFALATEFGRKFSGPPIQAVDPHAA